MNHGKNQCLTCALTTNTHLCSQVGYDDELLEDVLGEDVRESRLLDIIRGDVDVVGAQMQVGGRDGPHSPLRLARECRRLIVACGSGNYLVTMLQ